MTAPDRKAAWWDCGTEHPLDRLDRLNAENPFLPPARRACTAYPITDFRQAGRYVRAPTPLVVRHRQPLSARANNGDALAAGDLVAAE